LKTGINTSAQYIAISSIVFFTFYKTTNQRLIVHNTETNTTVNRERERDEFIPSIFSLSQFEEIFFTECFVLIILNFDTDGQSFAFFSAARRLFKLGKRFDLLCRPEDWWKNRDLIAYASQKGAIPGLKTSDSED
jgi:hypothetical protein